MLPSRDMETVNEGLSVFSFLGKGGAVMARVGVDIHIDATQALQTLSEAQKLLSPGKCRELLLLTLTDTGRAAKSVIGDTVTEDYVVTKGWAADKVGFPQVSGGLTVIVPVRGSRGVIGLVYPIAGASGGKKKRRIKASIVRSGVSTLPAKMSNQGGNPPFIGKGMVYTRKTSKRYPIVRVVGLGVPQMPINRSKEKIEKKLLAEMEKSATRHFGRLFGG